MGLTDKAKRGIELTMFILGVVLAVIGVSEMPPAQEGVVRDIPAQVYVALFLIFGAFLVDFIPEWRPKFVSDARKVSPEKYRGTRIAPPAEWLEEEKEGRFMS